MFSYYSLVSVLSLVFSFGCKHRDFNSPQGSQTLQSDASDAHLTELPDGRKVDLSNYTASTQDLQRATQFRYTSRYNSVFSYTDEVVGAQAHLQQQKKSAPFLANIPIEELTALKMYSDHFHQYFSKALSGNREILKAFEPIVLVAASGLIKFPIFSGSVWSGRVESIVRLRSLSVFRVTSIQ